MGDEQCKSVVIRGNVEIDGHGLQNRKSYLYQTNRHFQTEIRAANQKRETLERKPSYYEGYVRIIGLLERGGRKTVIKQLPSPFFVHWRAPRQKALRRQYLRESSEMWARGPLSFVKAPLV